MNMYNQLQTKARELGMCFLHVTQAHNTFPYEPLQYAYNHGYHADMKWLAENTHIRCNPHRIANFAQSIIVCGLPYYQPLPKRRGAIAMYALGRDYHKVFKKKLHILSEILQNAGYESRCFVDTAPILERPIAEKAGAGWIGKSSLLVSKEHGVLFFLGEIFTACVLPYHTPQKNKCGSCTVCIQACPTNAILPNQYIDARKCISYLTIEHKGTIPHEYRKAIGHRLYGCDECSVSCIYNSFTKPTQEPDFAARNYPDVCEILLLTPQQFTHIFAGSAIHRIGLERLQRNACVVLGNIGTEDDIPFLEHIQNNSNPMLAEHADWAIQAICAKTL